MRATASTAFSRLLPPAPRRALVLLDPSYEDKRTTRARCAASKKA
jgi:Protein involved in catabolism of external DNA